MSSIEDRLLEHEQEHLNPYEKLRKLQARQDQYKKMKDQQMAKSQVVEDIKEVNTDSTVHQKQVESFKPSLKNKLKWATDDDGEVCISPEEKKELISIEPETISSSNKLLHFLGYEIDLSAKVDYFKQSYQKSYIESKSHNFLLAKFSELKSGAFHMILSLLGIDTSELKKLQEQATEAAVEEKKLLYEQNVYNQEVFQLFSGSSKDQAKLKLFKEIEQQLELQLTHLGHDHILSKEWINTIQQQSVRKILQELLEEKQILEYQREFV